LVLVDCMNDIKILISDLDLKREDLLF
jgi:hypothetical protein